MLLLFYFLSFHCPFIFTFCFHINKEIKLLQLFKCDVEYQAKMSFFVSFLWTLNHFFFFIFQKNNSKNSINKFNQRNEKTDQQKRIIVEKKMKLKNQQRSFMHWKRGQIKWELVFSLYMTRIHLILLYEILFMIHKIFREQKLMYFISVLEKTYGFLLLFINFASQCNNFLSFCVSILRRELFTLIWANRLSEIIFHLFEAKKYYNERKVNSLNQKKRQRC